MSHIRKGLQYRVPSINNNAADSVVTLKDSSIMVHGPKLFNELPVEIREFQGSLATFKAKLDLWLKTVPDKPHLPQYHQSAAGNSVLQQLAQIRAERAA